MATTLTPTSKLDAVNVCLSNLGEAKVTSLTGTDTPVDAETASEIVDEISREVQNVGWNFNTEVMTLTPNTSDEIKLPANTLKADTAKINRDDNLVIRGDRLYDKENNTFTITEKKEVELVLFLAFDQLPESARRLIALRAARVMQERTLGEDSVSSQNRADENRAWAGMVDEESESGDYNILTGTVKMFHTTQRNRRRFI